jgi:hypothetical protein
MDLGADINDAFATRIPMSQPRGGPTMEYVESPVVSSQPVVLSPMNHVPSAHQHAAPGGVPQAAPPPPAVPLTGVNQKAYQPDPAPYYESGQAAPPAPPQPTGYIDALAARRKDILRLSILALMVTLGIGIHGLLSHYVTAWIDSGKFTARQEFFARLIYPAGVLFALWNLKALQ